MSDVKPRYSVGEISFGEEAPDPAMRGEGAIIAEALMALPPPNEKGQQASVFIAGVVKNQEVSTRISSLRKRGDLINADGKTMRKFVTRGSSMQDPQTGEEIKGLRVWRVADEPIENETTDASKE